MGGHLYVEELCSAVKRCQIKTMNDYFIMCMSDLSVVTCRITPFLWTFKQTSQVCFYPSSVSDSSRNCMKRMSAFVTWSKLIIASLATPTVDDARIWWSVSSVALCVCVCRSLCPRAKRKTAWAINTKLGTHVPNETAGRAKKMRSNDQRSRSHSC